MNEEVRVRYERLREVLGRLEDPALDERDLFDALLDAVEAVEAEFDAAAVVLKSV